MSVIKPLTYDEVKKAKIEFRKNNIPDFVVEAINCLLVQKFSANENVISISQNAIIDKILSLSNIGYTTNEIIDNGYLDFEELYLDFGWEVTYYKQDYNSPGSSFVFRSLNEE